MNEDRIRQIQKDYQASYLKIPSSMPLIVDKSDCSEIFKNSKNKRNDITNSEGNEPYLSEKSFFSRYKFSIKKYNI